MENISEQWKNSSNTTDTGLPSGYSTLHITLTCIVVIIIMLEIILGNILVIMAIVKDKNLKARQNWLIASLSVADLCVGSLIMPLSLTYELIGYWPFGVVVCGLWQIIDVLVCSSSILHLCSISLDRYWCVTRPLTYPQQRTVKRMALMVAFIWGLSAVISLPHLVWKNSLPEQEYPQCFINQDLGYVLYSYIGSFAVPLTTTCVLYAKVLHVARARARRNVPKKKTIYTVDISQTNQDMEMERPRLSSENQNKHVKEHDRNRNKNKTVLNVAAFSDISGAGDNTEPKLLHFQKNITNSSEQLVPRHQSTFTSRALTAFDNQTMKRKLAKARERRATVTVGLIIFCFALCWLPFSTSYVVSAIGNFDFPRSGVFAVFFWLGYVNSGINPLIYTIFNRDFRSAFRKILHL